MSVIVRNIGDGTLKDSILSIAKKRLQKTQFLIFEKMINGGTKAYHSHGAIYQPLKLSAIAYFNGIKSLEKSKFITTCKTEREFSFAKSQIGDKTKIDVAVDFAAILSNFKEEKTKQKVDLAKGENCDSFKIDVSPKPAAFSGDEKIQQILESKTQERKMEMPNNIVRKGAKERQSHNNEWNNGVGPDFAKQKTVEGNGSKTRKSNNDSFQQTVPDKSLISLDKNDSVGKSNNGRNSADVSTETMSGTGKERNSNNIRNSSENSLKTPSEDGCEKVVLQKHVPTLIKLPVIKNKIEENKIKDTRKANLDNFQEYLGKEDVHLGENILKSKDGVESDIVMIKNSRHPKRKVAIRSIGAVVQAKYMRLREEILGGKFMVHDEKDQRRFEKLGEQCVIHSVDIDAYLKWMVTKAKFTGQRFPTPALVSSASFLNEYLGKMDNKTSYDSREVKDGTLGKRLATAGFPEYDQKQVRYIEQVAETFIKLGNVDYNSSPFAPAIDWVLKNVHAQ